MDQIWASRCRPVPRGKGAERLLRRTSAATGTQRLVLLPSSLNILFSGNTHNILCMCNVLCKLNASDTVNDELPSQ